MQVNNFNKSLFIFLTGAFLVLTFVTMVAAAAEEEGTSSPGVIWVYLARMFWVFRFPTHTYFSALIDLSGPFTTVFFFGGLLANSLLYAFITERIIYLVKGKKQKLLEI